MELLKWLQLGNMLPVSSFVNFCRTCGSKVVLSSGALYSKTIFCYGRVCHGLSHNSRTSNIGRSETGTLDVRPLYKGHCSRSQPPRRGQPVYEEQNNLYSPGSVLCVQLILLVSRIPFTMPGLCMRLGIFAPFMCM